MTLKSILGTGQLLFGLSCVAAFALFGLDLVAYLLGACTMFFIVGASPFIAEKAEDVWDWLVIRWIDLRLSLFSRKGDNAPKVQGLMEFPAFSLASIPSKLMWWGAGALLLFASHAFIYHKGAADREHKIRVAQAAADAAARERVKERDRDVEQIGERTASQRDQISTISQRGRNAIRAARPKVEAAIDAELVRVWRAGLDELCIPRANLSVADPCGRVD